MGDGGRVGCGDGPVSSEKAEIVSRWLDAAWFDDLRRLVAASGDRARGESAPSEEAALSGRVPGGQAPSDQSAGWSESRDAVPVGSDLPEGSDLPDGSDLYVEVTVTNVPDVTGSVGGVVHGFAGLRGHQVVHAGRGSSPRPAAVTVSCPEEIARQIVAGVVPPSVAYMQGTMRMTGATGPVLDLLACTASPQFVQLLSSLEEVTEG